MKKHIAVIAAVGMLGLCGSSYGMATEQIEEKAPFAPASAIELVTLPRRDNVQLTIYNSTSRTSISDSEGYEGYEGAGVAMLIQESIEPESWFDLSDKGEGTIQVYDNTKLVVRQSREIHQEIEKLLQAIKGCAPGTVKSESWFAIDQLIVDASDNMETRVYDISDLGLGTGTTSDSDTVAVEGNKVPYLGPPFIPGSSAEAPSNSLTLVREKRNLTMKKGWNWLQFMWADTLIDPTSLSLEPLEQAGKIDIQQLAFPARLRELGRWLIRSEISGQVPFEITYFTSGLSWRAFYMGTLSQDEKTMHLAGYVRVANDSGEDYENAQTRLIVGNVHVLDQIAELAQRQYPYNRPISLSEMGGRGGGMMGGMMGGGMGGMMAGMGGMMGGGMLGGGMAGGMMGGMRPKEIRKEGLSEYFLCTIEGTETIADRWGKRLSSFEVEDIEIESLYKYDEERWGKQAIRFVSFANDADHNLGDTPIPDGAVKMFGRANGKGHLSYVGGTDIKYIPVDEEIELNLGLARLVKVEPKLMAFKTENYVFDNRGNVAGWDEIRTWQIETTNTRKLPIEIEITRGFGTAYWTLQTEMPYEKHDATHARFETQLEPQSKQLLSYTLTTYHGRREEQVSQ